MACIKPGSKLDKLREQWESHLIAQGVPAAQAAIDAEGMAVNRRVGDIIKERQRVWLQVKADVGVESRMRGTGRSGLDGINAAIERSGDVPDDTQFTVQTRERINRGQTRRLYADAVEISRKAASKSPAEQAALDLAVRRELLGVGTGKGDAAVAAKSMKAASDLSKTTANEAGMDIKTLSSWGYPERWSSERLQADAGAGFATDLLNAYRTPGAMAPLLDAAWAPLAGKELEKVVRKIADNIRVGNTGSSIGLLPSSMANAHTSPRILHFVDPEVRLRMEEKWGKGDIFHSFESMLDTHARETAAMQVFGPNVDGGFQKAIDRAVRAGATQAQVNRVETTYKAAVGSINRGGDPNLARRGATWRKGLSAVLLQRSILSQFSDVANTSMVNAMNGAPVVKSLVNFLKELPKELTPEHVAELARLGADADMAMARLNEDGVTETARRVDWVSEKTHQWSGRQGWERTLSELAQTDRLRDLASSRGLGLAEADAAMRGRLSRYGWTPDEWNWFRSVDPETIGGLEYASIDKIMSAAHLTPEQQTAAASRMLHHVSTDAAIATSTPGARTQGRMTFGLAAGTAGGEAARAGGQFRGFAVQNMMNHYAELMRLSAGDRVKYATYLFTATTVLGMASLQAKRLTKGQGLADMDPFTEEGRHTWLGAMFQGGGLGIFGDFLSAGFGGTNRMGGGFAETVAGPTVGVAQDAFDLIAGNAAKTLSGERANFGSEAAKFAGRYAPFIGLPYLNVAAQRLIIDQLRLEADPAGTRRSFVTMEQAQRRDYGAQSWWRAGQPLPDFLK